MERIFHKWFIVSLSGISQKPHNRLFHKCHWQEQGHMHWPGPITGDGSGNTMLRFIQRMYLCGLRMVPGSPKGVRWIHVEKGFCQVEEARTHPFLEPSHASASSAGATFTHMISNHFSPSPLLHLSKSPTMLARAPATSS